MANSNLNTTKEREEKNVFSMFCGFGRLVWYQPNIKRLLEVVGYDYEFEKKFYQMGEVKKEGKTVNGIGIEENYNYPYTWTFEVYQEEEVVIITGDEKGNETLYLYNRMLHNWGNAYEMKLTCSIDENLLYFIDTENCIYGKIAENGLILANRLYKKNMKEIVKKGSNAEMEFISSLDTIPEEEIPPIVFDYLIEKGRPKKAVDFLRYKRNWILKNLPPDYDFRKMEEYIVIN